MGAGNPTIHRPSRPSSVTLPTSRRGGGGGWKGSEIQRVQSVRHTVGKYLSSAYYVPGHQREWHGPVPMSQSLPSGCGEGRVSDKHTPRGNGGEAGAPRTRSGGGAGARRRGSSFEQRQRRRSRRELRCPRGGQGPAVERRCGREGGGAVGLGVLSAACCHLERGHGGRWPRPRSGKCRGCAGECQLCTRQCP